MLLPGNKPGTDRPPACRRVILIKVIKTNCVIIGLLHRYTHTFQLDALVIEKLDVNYLLEIHSMSQMILPHALLSTRLS